MVRNSRAKKEMDMLMKIDSELNEFNEKPVTPEVRKSLSAYLKKLTTDFGMVREDEGKIVKIWVSNDYKNHGMSEDIRITAASGKIHVDTWTLWKTIKGLDEQVRGD